MIRTRTIRAGLLAAALSWASAGAAQDLTITNARILDGNGGVIEQGSVIVRDGRIAEIRRGPAVQTAGRAIDAGGKTVMPGFIDAHRHLIEGDGDEWLSSRAAVQFQEFLAAGFTTVVSAIDGPQLLEARRRIEDGEMPGPRIYAAAFLPLSALPLGGGPEDPARTDPSRSNRPTAPAPAIPREATIAGVENAAAAGYDYIKTLMIETPNGPEIETLKLIVDEGAKHDLPVITHAVSVQDTLAALEAGPAVLVHTPHIGHLEEDPNAVRRIVGAGIPMVSTLSVFVPHFGDGNEPLFRDGQPFPWHTISSAGQGPINARVLWEAGITYGYGTDTQWAPKASLVDELRALRLVFSPRDVVAILTKHAAAAALKADELGTLEPGKLADLVIIDGNPDESSAALLDVVMTIKGGEVVFEQT